MGISIAAVQNTLELHNLGYFKNSKKVIEIGSQELHLKKNDLKELYDYAGLDSKIIDSFPNIDNYPKSPKCSAKYFYQSLGFEEYKSIDINSEHGAIKFDLNKPFQDSSLFNKFDLVTDHGSCEHVFNISECYKTIHNLTKKNGYIVIAQGLLKGNGYFLFDKSFVDGIAAANNYKIIFSSYTISTGTNTKNGSDQQFHIPQSETLYETINFSKIRNLGIYAVLQKQNNEDFKIPYQDDLMKENFNCAGFNRIYFKDSLSYSYIPSAKLATEETPFSVLIKEFIRRLTKKIKLFFS